MLRAARLSGSQRAIHYLNYSPQPKFSRVRNNMQVVSTLHGTAGFITLSGSIDYNVFRDYYLRDLSRAIFVSSM